MLQAGDVKERSPADWPNNIVDWDGPDDPEMPMNVSMVLMYQLVRNYLTSSGILPSASQLVGYN